MAISKRILPAYNSLTLKQMVKIKSVVDARNGFKFSNDIVVDEEKSERERREKKKKLWSCKQVQEHRQINQM